MQSGHEPAKTLPRATWITAMVAGILVTAAGIADWSHLGRRRIFTIRRSRTRPASAGRAVAPAQEGMWSVPIRIVLGEGNPAGFQHLRAFLEREGFDVLGTASDSNELVDLAVSLQPAVVILDRALPRAGALKAARQILNLCRETQVILLTPHAAKRQILAAFRAGVRGYVEKADTTPDLARAIRDVSRGRLFLSSGASRTLTEAYLPHSAMAHPEFP